MFTRSRSLNALSLLALTLMLGACASLTKEADHTKKWDAKRLYQEARSQIKQGAYETAIGYLQKLKARYPYGEYAAMGQLDLAEAHYNKKQMSEALAAVAQFIKLYPAHKRIDYAYYLRGMIHFKADRGFFSFILGKRHDYSDRDPKAAADSIRAFEDLLRRFPKSQYAEDSRQRIIYLKDMMARHEIHIARFYLERKAYVAAVNRCKYVLTHFQRTGSTEDALGIQLQAYRKMGMETLARDTERVLKLNFPKSRYLTSATG